MSTPFIAEMRIMSFNFAPKGWAQCNGQLLPINQNQALFSLLGTTYGGDGRVNFALPDYRSRMPLHRGQGFTQGQRGGEESHTLVMTEMPQHNHFVTASTDNADQASPQNNFFANGQSNAIYNSAISGAMAQTAVSFIGGNLPHENMSPFLVLNFCIALQGIFPSQT